MRAEDIAVVVDLMVRAGESPESRDLHTWDTPRDALAEELRSLADPVLVLEEGGRGALVLDLAVDKGRAWAWGPAVEGDDRFARADALLDEALRRTPAVVTRISAFPHVGSWLDAWWRHRGAEAVGVVHVYRAERGSVPLPPATVRAPLAEADLGALTRLHDAAFPATYLSAAEMLADTDGARRVLAADDGAGLVGYVCAEAQRDGTGYVHFLAVDPACRRRGLGRALLLAALHWLYDERGLPEVFLTVHESNDARHLYEQAGFSRLSSGQTMDLHRPRQ